MDWENLGFSNSLCMSQISQLYNRTVNINTIRFFCPPNHIVSGETCLRVNCDDINDKLQKMVIVFE